MALVVDREELLVQLFSICDEPTVKYVWAVGSVLESVGTEFTIDSDIDLYISVVDEKYRECVKDSFSDRPRITVLECGGTVIREVDVHLVLSPSEEPKSARGKPVEQIY